MKRIYVYLILFLFLLSACADTIQTNEPTELESSSDNSQGSPNSPPQSPPPAMYATPEREEPKPDITNLHPFAAALRQFIADTNGAAVAFLVDIDGNGIEGMLAIDVRMSYPNFPHGIVFYLYNDTLSYKDLGRQGELFTTRITAEGNRVVHAMGDGGRSSYTLFGIENGRLVETLNIYIDLAGFEDDELLYNLYTYYGSWNEGWNNRKLIIAQKEYGVLLAFLAEYGLDNFRAPWWDDVDESNLILSMTLCSSDKY